MAFGKPPETKVLKVAPTIADQLWKANVHSEENAAEAWKTKWGWILDEYKKLNAKMDEVSKNSVLLKDIAPKGMPELRTIKPFPETASHEFGWLASRPEFKLEKYGSDVYKGMPYVDLYL